jgi:phosphatidylglycerophosphatase C
VAKERVLMHCLSGMKVGELREQGERFAKLALPGLLRPEALARLAWHKASGHRCVAISASLDLYVHPWAVSAGFDDVIATHLEAHDGCVTGKLLDGNCYGPEKVKRLAALLGDKSGYTLYAYGDSRGDRELLACADHAYYREMPNG